MRIGLNEIPEHTSPEEWADILAKKGYRAAVFPGNYRTPVHVLDAYVKAANSRDIMIAEVGVWTSPFVRDPVKSEEARCVCEEQFRLADYVQAECCVNVSGASGDNWYGCFKDNFSESLYKENLEFIRELCDRVKPVYTSYVLEPMQWMLPDSPEQYLRFLKDVNRPAFKVHMDVVNFVKDPYTYTHIPELIHTSFDLLSPYIKSCHLKDFAMGKGTTVVIQEVPIGEGAMDFASYLGHIGQLGADIPVLIEHQQGMAAYDKALGYIRQHFLPCR